MFKNDKKALLVSRDEELVKLIQEGNQLALDELYIRYKGLIYEVTYKYMITHNIAQMYLDDFIDVGIDSLIVAAKSFTVGQDWSFLSFWWVIMERKQNDFLSKTIESRVSYFDPMTFEYLATSLNDSSPNNDIDVMSHSLKETIRKYSGLFTDEEMCFLEYYLAGYQPLEIADLLSWNKSKLYRIKKKATSKLNKIFKSN